jgi:hypothetical protein
VRRRRCLLSRHGRRVEEHLSWARAGTERDGYDARPRLARQIHPQARGGGRPTGGSREEPRVVRLQQEPRRPPGCHDNGSDREPRISPGCRAELVPRQIDRGDTWVPAQAATACGEVRHHERVPGASCSGLPQRLEPHNHATWVARRDARSGTTPSSEIDRADNRGNRCSRDTDNDLGHLTADEARVIMLLHHRRIPRIPSHRGEALALALVLPDCPWG